MPTIARASAAAYKANAGAPFGPATAVTPNPIHFNQRRTGNLLQNASRRHADEDEPKLCPDSGPDQPGSEAASERAQEYQEQISRMINPQRPLEYGLAMSLLNPLSGNLVHFDECDEKTGAMIEAKGPGFDGLLSFPQGADSLDTEWLNQSYRQVQAAGSRQIKWYFAETHAAEHAKQLFGCEGEGRENIIIKVQPAVKP